MDNIALVNDKISEFSDLYKRMDKTRALLEDKYKLKNFEDKDIPKSVSVTRNTAAWQANVMSDKLMKLKWQTKVESSNKLPKTLISHVEQFANDVCAQVDDFIATEYGIGGGADGWKAKKIVRRGIIGERILLYYKNDKLVIDYAPLDMRWVPFELNEWANMRLWLPSSELQKKYPGDATAKLSGKDIEVWDFWDKKRNEVYVVGGGTTFTSTSTGASSKLTGDKIDEKPNVFETLPFVIVMSSAGNQFRDRGYLEHEAESFDWLDRNLYDEANRSASIAQTLALSDFLMGFVKTTKGNVSDPVPDPPMPDETVHTAIGEEYIPIERGKLAESFLKASQIIDQDIMLGGVSPMESGNTGAPNTAIMVTTVNAILIERAQCSMDAIATSKILDLSMELDQYIKLSKLKKVKEVDIGVQGMTHRHKASDLGDPSTYRITYVPSLNSKDQNIANVAVAAAQRGLLPTRFILEETLQVEDPDGLIRELEMEKAKALDPSIGLIEQAIAFVEDAEDLEGDDKEIALAKSMSLYDSAIVIMKQRDMATIPQPVGGAPAATTTPGAQEEPKSNLQGIMGLGAQMPKVVAGGNGGSPEATTKGVAK